MEGVERVFRVVVYVGEGVGGEGPKCLGNNIRILFWLLQGEFEEADHRHIGVTPRE
jgi:hypothetical protein